MARECFRVLALMALLVAGAWGCGMGFDGVDPHSDQPTMLRPAPAGDVYVISEADANFYFYEAPEQAGECSEDVDCATGGCSAEVCTTARVASEIQTACNERHPGEDLNCGCYRTRCRWTKPIDP